MHRWGTLADIMNLLIHDMTELCFIPSLIVMSVIDDNISNKIFMLLALYYVYMLYIVIL